MTFLFCDLAERGATAVQKTALGGPRSPKTSGSRPARSDESAAGYRHSGARRQAPSSVG